MEEVYRKVFKTYKEAEYWVLENSDLYTIWIGAWTEEGWHVEYMKKEKCTRCDSIYCVCDARPDDC